MDITLQADPSLVIPPYFALDRNDKTVPHLTSSFLVKDINSFFSIKRYFSKLSDRNVKGNMYCSIILVQNITYREVMDKARSALVNLDYGIVPKASNHKETEEIGWLLNSTPYQDEEIQQYALLFSSGKIGAKWRPS